MKRLIVITNALLAVIALCLCLVVARLYDISLAGTAHAQTSTRTSGPLPVRVVNDQLPCTVDGPVEARIRSYDGIGWDPVRSYGGALVVKEQE